MKTNSLVTAVALSDRDLLTRIDALATTEREATAELVAHLTALELCPSLYLAQGYGSLFDYCTRALRLSEDAACTRTKAVRACRRFPVILDHLASGALTLTSVRLLGPHLTAENHEAVLARAKDKALREIQALVAELAPRPDVPSSVRKLPVRKAARSTANGSGTASLDDSAPNASLAVTFGVAAPASTSSQVAPALIDAPPSLSSQAVLAPIDRSPKESSSGTGIDQDQAIDERPRLQALPVVLSRASALPSKDRPIVKALAPQRYRVQFTIAQEAHDKLRRVQALLRREIPNGDPAAIFERALDLLLERVERSKIGAVTTPRRAGEGRQRGPYEKRIRFKTDKSRETPRVGVPSDGVPCTQETRPGPNQDGPGSRKALRSCNGPSRHIPNAVKRAVWHRDAGQCAFVSATGRRCIERNFLELHHIQPYALEGPATVGNISLRCRQHNQYEAEVIFGPLDLLAVSETRVSYRSGLAVP